MLAIKSPFLNKAGWFFPWPEETKNVLCRIRYRQPLEEAKLFMKTEGLYIIFKNYQRGIAKGQFAAWYEGAELIGSGVIN